MLFISFIISVVISLYKNLDHVLTESDPFPKILRACAPQEWDAKPLNFTAFYTLAGSGRSGR